MGVMQPVSALARYGVIDALPVARGVSCRTTWFPRPGVSPGTGSDGSTGRGGACCKPGSSSRSLPSPAPCRSSAPVCRPSRWLARRRHARPVRAPKIWSGCCLGLLGQRLAALALAVDVALQLARAEPGFHVLGAIGRIGPDTRAGVAPRQQVVHRLAVVQGGIADMVTPHQLVLPVHTHMVLVAIVGFPVLTRRENSPPDCFLILLAPAGINVLL